MKKIKSKPQRSINGASRFRRWWVPFLWVVPGLTVLATFYLYPFCRTIYLSFTDADPVTTTGKWVWFENYVELIKDHKFHTAVLNSTVYALVVVPIMIMLPLLLALLVKDHVPGIGFFRAMYYIPAVSSLVVVSLAWNAVLRDNGWINEALMRIGMIDSSIPFLTGRWLLLFSSMIITLWQGLPYYMILYITALANIDRSLYDAAEVDGAGVIKRFTTVTIPGVRNMMILVGTLCTIGCLKIFTEVHLLSNGSGGPTGESITMTMYLRTQGLDVTYGNLGIGSAASVFLFCFTVIFIAISQYVSNRKEVN